MSSERETQQKDETARRPAAPDAAPGVETTPEDQLAAGPERDGLVGRAAANPTELTLQRAAVQQLQAGLGNARVARLLVQRKDAPDAPAAASEPAGAESESAAGPPSSLIVEDGAEPQPGQLPKSAFLAQLRPAVEAAVASALGASPLAALAQPEIERQFAEYAALSAQALEQAITRQVPGAAGASSAEEYIPAITAQVRQAAREQADQPGAELLGGAAEAASSVAEAASGVVSGVGSALSSVGSLLFKANAGGAQPLDAGAVQAQLGAGQALDGGVREGLEAAFGQGFGDVRVHPDGQASRLAGDMNARAFTVGQDIAFAPGEYQPGTPVGDALIAHEVAHVAQQRGASAAGGVQAKGGGEYGALEEDADRAAVGAVAQMWGGLKSGAAALGSAALPRLRSGLRLQRCSGEKKADDKWKAVESILQQSATGKEALARQQKYGVSVSFVAGGGSVYKSSSNTMIIDDKHPPARAALSFVHEMNHAYYFHEGLKADKMKLSRDDYIKGMVNEEAEGVVKSIEAKIELEGTKVDVSKTSYPLEGEYRKAYNDEITAAKAADPSLAEAELKRRGREAGKKRVIKGFMDGEVETSNTHEPYPQYYGKEWDNAHPTP